MNFPHPVWRENDDGIRLLDQLGALEYILPELLEQQGLTDCSTHPGCLGTHPVNRWLVGTVVFPF